jgi:hypothetical protein
MDKYILQDETAENRLKYLEDSADQVVEEKYYQRLSKEELTIKKADFTANALKMDDVEQEKKEKMDEFKEKLKPLKETHRTLATEIRTGFVQKEGRLYKFVDQDTRMVHFYDETGELIETMTRPCNSSELQNTIHMSLRTGTDNK